MASPNQRRGPNVGSQWNGWKQRPCRAFYFRPPGCLGAAWGKVFSPRLAHVMLGLGNDPFCQKPQRKRCGIYFALDHMYYLIKSATDTGASSKFQKHSPTTQIDNFSSSRLTSCLHFWGSIPRTSREEDLGICTGVSTNHF